MRFAEVIARSVYGATSYLAAPADLQAVESTIRHSLPVLRRFTRVLVATNYRGEGGAGGGGEAAASRAALAAANARLWRRYFPDCVLLDSDRNRGHSIGTSDLDNLLFDHCKAEGAQWLCKSATDVLLSAPVLEIEVHEADFYYLDAVSCDALAERDFDLSAFSSPPFFFPQTTFYAIDVSRTDHLVDKAFLDASWRTVSRIPGYDGRIWEHIPRWSCELLLRKCVLRNGLTRCRLLNDDQWEQVLALVRQHRITDCSLKNVTVNGICHAHPQAGGPAVTVADGRPGVGSGPQPDVRPGA